MIFSRRQFIVNSIFAATALSTLSSCSASKPLRVGIHPWIGYESMYLAEDFGLLPKNISLVKGNSASETIQRLKTGDVVAAALTLDEVLRVRNQGIPLTVVWVFDTSAGADMLLVHPDITTLSQLKGKRIGYEGSAVGELMMSKILQKAGLAPQDVVSVNTLPPNKQLDAWQKGEIDAVITYEPIASLLKAAGAEVLFDSREIPETIFDVLAVKTDVLERNESSVRQLVKANFLALNRMNSNLGDAIYRIAEHEHIQPDEVKDALRGVILPGLAFNRHYLSEKSSFYQSAKALNQLMLEKGMLSKSDDFSNLFSHDYLPETDI